MMYVLLKKINELKNKIKKPKTPNPDIIINLDEDQDDIKNMEDFISSQQKDLNKLRIKMITLMNKINKNI